MIEINRKFHIDKERKIRTPLIEGYYYREWNKQNQRYEPFQFLGTFNCVADVPCVEGIYFLKGEHNYFLNRIDNNKILAREREEKNRERSKRSNDKSLDYTIYNHDNDLKILAKRLLEGCSSEDLKKLFDLNIREYNNFRSALLGAAPDLSWNRFTDLLRRLKLKYELTVYLEDNNSISNKDDINKTIGE